MFTAPHTAAVLSRTNAPLVLRVQFLVGTLLGGSLFGFLFVLSFSLVLNESIVGCCYAALTNVLARRLFSYGLHDMEALSKNSPAVQVERSDSSSEEKSFDFGAKLRKTWTSLSRSSTTSPRHWTTPALHPVTLILAILTPLALLTTLQLLLNRSQRDNGLIFAPDINALPLSRTFLYQYFPTIVAVIFSIFWSWIDLEVKRLEPYYRLSREEGALGKDSLLLCYPFSFLPFVPVRAFKERHWPVFWASLGLVLVTWGLVPTQAGIFSVRQVSRSFPTKFNVSTRFIPAEQQPAALTLRFAQSAYGIVALNETLPPYMTREYMLAPFAQSFGIDDNGVATDIGKWTAPTTMYGLDLQCKPAITIPRKGWPVYNSTTGCSMTVGQSGNRTQSVSQDVKPFSAMYAGYWPSIFELSHIDECPPERNHTFYAAFTRNKEKDEDPPQNVTAIFCEPFYFEQEVNATIDSHSKQPISFVALKPKQQLTGTKFNTTWLEQMMSVGETLTVARGDVIPGSTVPSWVEQLADTDLTDTGENQPMVGMAAVIAQRTESLQDYLDWHVLASSYQQAWRLIFARAMADVLGGDLTDSKQVAGERTVFTEAVTLSSEFTYIVEGLLGVVSIVAVLLLLITSSRPKVLRSNPSTIASLMSLVAENEPFLADFESLDCCALKDLQEPIEQARYRLIDDGSQTMIHKITPAVVITEADRAIRRVQSRKLDYKPIRPIEFSAWTSIPFVGLFVFLVIGLAILFVKSRLNGLPLPSNNKIVQNLVENYIPTAVATLIEPMWVLINRLLCLLQPIEELRDCDTKAKHSINLDYSSFPPQLVLFKALRARHLLLACVCAMALLANVLAVAFAGLFYHATVEVRVPTTFQPPFETRFVTINGSVGPVGSRYAGSAISSGAYRGGRGRDQYLVDESNNTGGTPLPAWTAEERFYFPFKTTSSESNQTNGAYEADTTALGAELDCEEIKDGDFFPISLGDSLNISLTRGDGKVECATMGKYTVQPGPQASGPGEYACQTGPSALELVFTLEAESLNASLAEKQTCWGTVVMGWVRDPVGSCNSTRKFELNANNSFFVQCQPRLVQEHGSVRVDAEGRLVKEIVALGHTPDKIEAGPNLVDGLTDLIGQSNRYLFQMEAHGWHNDSFPGDFINYFASRAVNSSRLLDPKRSLPSLNDIQMPLSKAYSRLFAIWLGLNKEQLLVPRANESTISRPGWRVVREERLFLSTAMFAIGEGILAMYAAVAILVYLRRPGEYLPRLPTSMASVIGLFAAGGAVRDMRGTSHFGYKERANHFEKLDTRYGYGNYVGVDGMVHVGIEKTPFVRLRTATRSSRT